MDDNILEMFEYVDTKTPWIDNSLPETIEKQASLACKKLCEGKDKNHKLTRICGQTGSGKTTQLLWAVEQKNKELSLNPITLGIRCFAKFHPKYGELLKEFGANEIREKTNGFALKCMIVALKILLDDGYDILLDLTLLDPAFEKYVLSLETQNNYSVTYHILAVNTAISKQFLSERQKSSGRIVYDSSTNYFNDILNKGFKFVCDNDQKNLCFVWTAFDKSYVFKGKVCEAYQTFIFHQKRIEPITFDPETLKKEKLKAISL